MILKTTIPCLTKYSELRKIIGIIISQQSLFALYRDFCDTKLYYLRRQTFRIPIRSD